MSDVRLARRAVDLHRTARSAYGSWRKVGAEVKASRRWPSLPRIVLKENPAPRLGTPRGVLEARPMAPENDWPGSALTMRQLVARSQDPYEKSDGADVDSIKRRSI